MTQRRRDMVDIFAMNQAAPVQASRATESHDSLHTAYIWDVSQIAQLQNPAATPDSLVVSLLLDATFSHSSEGFSQVGKLAFQGIPVDRLQLDKTEIRLGDLAGNAMSLPVISAAMLATFCVKQFARERIEDHEFQLKPPNPEMLVTSSFAPPCNDDDTFDPDAEDDALSFLQEMAKLASEAESSSALCICETSGGSSSAPIICCSHCNLTLCRACSDRGMRLDCHHMLELEIPPTGRAGAIGFEQKLRRVSPSCFRLLNEAAAVAIGDPEIARAIFHLRKVKRKRGFWELTYTAAAQNGRLLGDLICSIGRVPQLAGEAPDSKGLAAYIRVFPENKRGILPPVARIIT